MALTLMGALLVAPATASATPPSGIEAVTVATVTRGTTQYILRRLTFAPGGSTGWHTHDGPVFAIVRTGVLTHVDATCRRHLHRVGEAIVDDQDLHLGLNTGATPLVLDAYYTVPAGHPLSRDAPAPNCAHS